MKQQDSGQPPHGSPGDPQHPTKDDKAKAGSGKDARSDHYAKQSTGQAEGTDPSLAHGKELRREIAESDDEPDDDRTDDGLGGGGR